MVLVHGANIYVIDATITECLRLFTTQVFLSGPRKQLGEIISNISGLFTAFYLKMSFM